MSVTVTARRRPGALAAGAGLVLAAVTYAAPALGAPEPSAIPIRVCFGQPVTIVAQPGVPTIGTEGSDVILGTNDAAGDDIDGRGGADRICALGGPDRVLGGNGDDLVAGGDGDDKLQGEGHDDAFDCGAGTDVADGGPGIDSLLPKAACELASSIP